MNKRIFRIILKVVYILIALFFLSYILVSFIAPKNLVNVFGFKIERVLTPSMDPKIKVNDAVFVVKARAEKLKEGDIINFEAYVETKSKKIVPITITHYLGEIFEEEAVTYYKTQSFENREIGSFDSDWVNEEGESIDITFENINGKIAFTIPYLGYLIMILQDPIMVGLIVINIGLVYIIFKLAFKKKQST
jgi:signal peptidase I